MKFGQTIGNLILFFHLDDAYHSWWYVATLFFFLINLITCSLKRFPISLKLFKKDPAEIDPEKLPNKISIQLKKDPARIVAFICDRLGFQKIEENKKGGYLFVKDKNRWGYFGVYVVHFSLVLIILGGLIGAIWGFRGDLYLIEGDSSNQVIPFREKEPLFLEFSVKLNKFIMELYPNGMPKEYISDVTIIDKNKSFNTLIKVNHPLRYKGISLYQESYDEIPQFIINIKFNKNQKKEEVLTPMKPITLKDRYILVLEAYMKHRDFTVAKVRMIDEQTGETQEFFLIEKKPSVVRLGKQKIVLNLVKTKTKYVSILQVKKDPGIFLVYSGFILMILGLLVVYFFEPKTFWIFVKSEGEKLLIYLGAKAKREKDTLVLKIKELAEKLEQEA
jgi:cytochrome c biogenesis protein